MARKMKDSGIEWIGEIPKGWEVVPVKRLCTMQAGKNLTSEQIAPEGTYPVYGGNGIRGFFSDYNCDGQFLTVGRQGALCGNVHKINGKVWATEHAVITTPSSYTILDFLYYLLIGMDLNQYVSSTAAQPGLAVGTLLNLKTCYPCSTLEQTQISNYLNAKCSEIDIMLTKTRSSIEEYKKLKQAVITRAVTKGVRGEQEMKDSGVEWIGEIPKTWIISNIGRFCFVTKLAGFEYTKEMDGHISPYGDVPIVRAQNIKMGRFIPNTREYISLALSQKLSRCALNEKCLIITFIGTGIGEVALFSDATRHHLAPNVAKIVINHDMKQFLDDRFLLYFLMSSAGQEEVNKIKKATAQPSLSMQTIRSIKLAFPSTLQEQKEIADFLDAKCAEIDKLIAKKEQLVKELESYKKSLIYEVVTGKREV